MNFSNAKPPVALTIAGSDNSAGAGIQADLKTFSAHGVYGLTAVTCVVAEVPDCVLSIQAIEPKIVAEQIRLSLAHFPVAAIKTGMLFSEKIIRAVVEVLRVEGRGIPLVVDPVMVATSGDSLLEDAAVALYREDFLPMATLVTPNLDEAAVLLEGRAIRDLHEMEEAGKRLSAKFGVPFLMKGGHLLGERAVDLLILGEEVHVFEAAFVRGAGSHGTGCTYSAAIAAELACGKSLPEAVGSAKRTITAAIERSFSWENEGGRTRALNHFARENG